MKLLVCGGAGYIGSHMVKRLLCSLIPKRRRQRGFMLLELVVVMGIIGLLAAVAVPKFTDTMTNARTARVQADMQVINSAIVMRMAEKGVAPATLSDLSDYVNNISDLKPPSGTVYLKDGGTASATEYTLATGGAEALFAGKKLSEIGKPGASSGS